MKNITYIPLFTLLLSACGSNFSATKDEIGPDASAGNAGQAQDAAGNAGQESIAGNNSVGGADNAGSAGSINGQAGAMNSAGSAGIENIAGMSSGGANNAGTGGMTNTCKPITCDSYSLDKAKKSGLACGSLDDGCGNMLDCGNCNDHSNCGGISMVFDSKNERPTIIPSIANICADSCYENDTNLNQKCEDDANENPNKYINYVSCTMNFSEPPQTNCTKITVANQSSSSSTWCCINTYK